MNPPVPIRERGAGYEKISKKSLCLAAAALTLTAGISAGTAMAYFTTYAEASRSIALDMPGFSETDTIEKFSNWTKHVQFKTKAIQLVMFV